MSYEFKGTPGPWLKVCGKAFVYALDYSGTNIFQLMVDGAHCPSDVKEANARAIAELPELISVLTEIVERWDSLVPEGEISEEHKRARAALTKATGGDQ